MDQVQTESTSMADISKGEIPEDGTSFHEEAESVQLDSDSEDHVVEMDAGLELNFDSEDDVILQDGDCKKCLVVIAAFCLVTLNFMFTSLHTKSLDYVGRNISTVGPFPSIKPSLSNFPAYPRPGHTDGTGFNQNETENRFKINRSFPGASNHTLDGGDFLYPHNMPVHPDYTAPPTRGSDVVNLPPGVDMDDIKSFMERQNRLPTNRGIGDNRFGHKTSSFPGYDHSNPSFPPGYDYKNPSFPPGYDHKNPSFPPGYDHSNPSFPQEYDHNNPSFPTGYDPNSLEKFLNHSKEGNYTSGVDLDTLSKFQESNLKSFQEKYGLEMKLQKLLMEYYAGNASLVDNITSLLSIMNRSDEAGQLLTRPGFGDLFPPLTLGDVVPPSQPVADTFGALFSCVGVFSSSLILLTSYRVVSVAGSLLTCLTCLCSTFCSTNRVSLLAFLYGALPGIGQNMIIVSATVAILENFSRRRLTALLIPHIGSVLGTMVLFLLGKWLFPAIGLTSWKSYLLLQTGVAGTMVLFSGLLYPARLKMRSGEGETFVSKLFGYKSLRVYKSWLLYCYAAIVFVWEGGLSVIIAKLPSFTGSNLIPFFSVGQLLVALLLLTSLVGLCVNCCVPSSISCRCSLILMGVLSTLASVLSLHASLLYNPIFALVYSAVLGVFKGLTDPFLELLAPLMLGEDNIVVGTGVMATSRGISALSMVKLADKIEGDMKRVDWCFYLTGLLFFLAIPLTYISNSLYRTHNQGDSPGSGSRSPEESKIDMEEDTSKSRSNKTPLSLNASPKETLDLDRSSLKEEQLEEEQLTPEKCNFSDRCEKEDQH